MRIITTIFTGGKSMKKSKLIKSMLLSLACLLSVGAGVIALTLSNSSKEEIKEANADSHITLRGVTLKINDDAFSKTVVSEESSTYSSTWTFNPAVHYRAYSYDEHSSNYKVNATRAVSLRHVCGYSWYLLKSEGSVGNVKGTIKIGDNTLLSKTLTSNTDVSLVDGSNMDIGVDYTGVPSIKIETTGTSTYKFIFRYLSLYFYEYSAIPVTLDDGEGTGGQGTVNLTYDEVMSDVTVPTRTAYRFDGYYSGPNGTGTQYYDENGVSTMPNKLFDSKAASMTLYAKWTLMQFDVALNQQGGTGGTELVQSIYGQDMPSATMPTRVGYDFTGYYDEETGGKKYYNADGTSATTYDKTEDSTLYAHWDALEYHTTFNSSPGTGGLSELDIYYDDALLTLTEEQIPSLAASGGHSYSFGGYFTEAPTANGDGSYTPHGTQYYDKDGNGVGVWKEANNTTVLYAYYTIDMEVSSSGYTGTWDGQNHSISVSVSFPEGTITYYGDSAATCNNSNASDFIKSVAGSYDIYYEVRKDGYTPYAGHETIEITKDSSYINPIPAIVENLEYTGSAQKLIDSENPGVADYGNMLYALSSNKEVLPEDSAFSASIPTATNVGEYYVFYKTSGDDNHNPVAASLDNYVTVTISRVDRTEVIDLNDEVEDFLSSYEDRFPGVCATLEGVRAEVYQDAIVEDNINSTGVSENVTKLQNAYETAKVAIAEALINAIGEMSYPESREAILEAYDFFNETLSDEERALVDPSLVTVLENDKEVLDHIEEVADAINNLPTAAQLQDYYDAVDNAKALYDGLTPSEQALIDNASDVDYEKVLDNNKTARDVIEEIQNIGDVTFDGGVNDSKDDIKNAEDSYAGLSEEAKAIVDSVNHNTLQHDREVYDNVEETVNLINNIGEVSHSEQSKGKLDEARNAYNQLSEEERALVGGYNNSYKTLDDNEHVYEAMILIDKIGDPQYSSESEADIKAAREFYDSLSEDQKALLGNKHFDTLKKAEESYSVMKKNGNILVISLLCISILALIVGSYFMYRLLKSRVKKEAKALSISIVPIMFASHYVTGPFLVLYIIAALTLLVWASDLVLLVLKKKEKWIYNPNLLQAGAIVEKEEVKTISDEEGNTFQISYVKSFKAKLLQASEEEKGYYSELRNLILSYKDLSNRLSWNYESFNLGRKQLVKLGVRGKTLCVYLALNVESIPQKYEVEKIESAKYEDVSCMYRIKNTKRCEIARQLIIRVMKENQVKQGEEHNEKYSLSYLDRDALVNKGLIKEKKTKIS